MIGFDEFFSRSRVSFSRSRVSFPRSFLEVGFLSLEVGFLSPSNANKTLHYICLKTTEVF